MSYSAGYESDLSFSDFETELLPEEVDEVDNVSSEEEVEDIDILPSPQDNRGVALPADLYDHLSDDEDSASSSSSSSFSSSSSSPRLPDSPYWVSVKALSVPETVKKLIFQTSNELEGTNWREEFRTITSRLLQKAEEKQLSLTIENFNRADLLRILFEPLAHLLTNSEYRIFDGESPNERLTNFGFFMATLNILKVSGLSFAELEHPTFQSLRVGLRLLMPLTVFKETLKRLQIECRKRKGQLFFNLEKVFSKTNIDIFYSPNMVLGADDDKMPTRSDALSEMGIKKKEDGRADHFPPVTISTLHMDVLRWLG